MKTKLTLTMITLAGLIIFAGYIRGGNSSAAGQTPPAFVSFEGMIQVPQ